MTDLWEKPVDPEADAGVEGRRQTRARSRHLVGLKMADGRVCNGLLLDISLIGARVESSAPLTVGDSLTFSSVRMGERPAEVVWSEGKQVGLRFLDKMAAQAVTRRRNPAC